MNLVKGRRSVTVTKPVSLDGYGYVPLIAQYIYAGRKFLMGYISLTITSTGALNIHPVNLSKTETVQ